MKLSEKQILSIYQANKRFNIWVGAVRSGKTFSSIRKLIDLLREGVPGDVMIIGVNRESIQRNILNDLYSILGFPPPSSKTNESKIYGRNIYFVGAHDESAVRRIQGSTLAYALVDEATCIPHPFWRMLISRLSVKGAQLLATCNPEGPNHWLKKEFIDREKELDLISWHFVLDDNPSLDDSYKENLKKEYGSGAWYKRYILGEWALASGLIFDSLDDDNFYSEDNFSSPNYYIAGIDYGTCNPTTCVLVAVTPKIYPQLRVVDEYCWDSRKEGRSKFDAELADDIKKFIGYRSLDAIYVDPSAASIKNELRALDLPVLDANNDVLEGIKIVGKFITGKNLMINRQCRKLREELLSYTWDMKAADKGVDKPVKHADHLCDGLRYALASAFPYGEIDSPDENISIEERRRRVYGDNAPYFASPNGYF